MHPQLEAALTAGLGVLDRRGHRHLRTLIDHAVRGGELVRVVPNVYARPVDAPTLATRARAVCLADPDAIITGQAAAIIGGWEDLAEPKVIEVATRRVLRARPGLRQVRRTIPAGWWRTVNGIRITTFPLTALDLALQYGTDRLDDALRRGVEPSKLRLALDALPGRRGYAALRREVEAVRDRPWSLLERRAHEVLRGAGLTGWRANRATDGHTQRDKARDRRLNRLGWEVIRFESDLVLNSPEEFVAIVRDILTTRRKRLARLQA